MKKLSPKSEILQFHNVYQSTYDFEKFLKRNKVLNKKTNYILDVGTGLGANLKYFSKKNNNCKFLGIDYQKHKINEAIKLNSNPNIKFKFGDILKKNKFKKTYFDLVMSIHNICCFKNLDKPLKFMCGFRSEWIAINSLFYDGPLDVWIHIRDLTKDSKTINYEDCMNTLNLLNAFYYSSEINNWVTLDSIINSSKLGRCDENISKLYRSAK